MEFKQSLAQRRCPVDQLTRRIGLIFPHQLHTLLVVPLVDVEPIGYVGVFGQGGGAVKPDGINQLALGK